MLDGQVVVIGDRHLEVAGRIVLTMVNPFGKTCGLGEGQSEREWI
jgi:hypothetical protein